MGPTRINGLPAHVLLVHVVVAMVPITALLLLLTIFWPEARRRIGVALPVVALFTLITVPITTHAGEWLEDHLGGSSPLIAKHADLGDQLLPWAIATFVISAVVWGVNIRYARTAPGGRPPAALNIALAVLAVVVAIGSVVMVYRIGDSGAKATWQGTATGGS
jgi:formate hydrogenlyase subunit 3/multisubunit Na+/H+ antiporter MnhD subunit